MFDKISVCLPTYKSVAIIEPTLKSILAQSHKDFEIIIGNDYPQDHKELVALMDSYNDKRIKVESNEVNLGYPSNIKKVVARAENEILFFMCQDDRILDPDLFKKILQVFNENSEIGVITRPYYWFTEDVNKPNRVIPKWPKRVISLDDDEKDIRAMMDTVGQLSGLVFRKSLIRHNFGDHVFPAHAYPFYSIMRTHKCYFWPEFMVAVWTAASQTKHVSTIYSPAPTWSWVHMFETVLPEARYKKARDVGISLFANNHFGLVQIKNYGKLREVIADAYYLVKARKINLLRLRFWAVFLGVILVPKTLLIGMVNIYHNVIRKYHLRKLELARES